MFNNWKKDNKAWQIFLLVMLGLFIVVALVFALFNFSTIWDFLKGLVNALMPFIYGFIIAYLCNAIHKKLHKYVFKFVEKKKPHPKLRKALSIITTYIIFFAIITLLLFAIIPQIIASLSSIDGKALLDSATNFFNNTVNEISKLIPGINTENVLKYINSLIGADGGIISNVITDLTQNILNIFMVIVEQVFSIIVGFILSIYFLIYKEKIIARIKRILCAIFKKENYEKIVDFARYTDKTFGRYLVGSLLDSLLVGFVIFLILTIFNFPYPLLIGVIVAVTNIIPFFGPFIGAIPSAFLILIDPNGGFWMALIFVIIIIVVQQIDGNVIAPHIQGTATGLTPIGVIFSVTLCSYLFGFIGMLIGVPLGAVVTYLITGLIEKTLKKKKLPINVDCYLAKDVFTDEGFIKAQNAIEASERAEHHEAVEKARVENKIKEEEIHIVEERIVEEIINTVAEETKAKAEAEQYQDTNEVPAVKEENETNEQ